MKCRIAHLGMYGLLSLGLTLLQRIAKEKHWTRLENPVIAKSENIF